MLPTHLKIPCVAYGANIYRLKPHIGYQLCHLCSAWSCWPGKHHADGASERFWLLHKRRSDCVERFEHLGVWQALLQKLTTCSASEQTSSAGTVKRCSLWKKSRSNTKECR
jgi:hypothetical protein